MEYVLLVPKSYKWMVVEATLNDENETYDKTDIFIDEGNGGMMWVKIL